MSKLVGVLVVAILCYIALNTLRTHGPGSRGVPAGRQLPPFAVPLATSTLQGDANVATRPDEGAAGRRPACQVRGPRILNSCQLAERGPVALAFFATKSRRCEDQVSALDRLRARFPDVGFAAVAIRGSRADVRALVRTRGWRLPVGYDHDGAVANAYGVAVCPTMTFAYRGGKVAGTALSALDTAGVARWLRRIRAR
jgi:AhpC/TSA family protein